MKMSKNKKSLNRMSRRHMNPLLLSLPLIGLIGVGNTSASEADTDAQIRDSRQSAYLSSSVEGVSNAYSVVSEKRKKQRRMFIPAGTYQNVHLPSKVGFALPDPLVEVPQEQSAQSLDSSNVGQFSAASVGVPQSSSIGMGLYMTTGFNQDTAAKLMLLDAAFDSILRACEGFGVGEVCRIPDGQVSATYTREMANTNYEYWKGVIEKTSRYPTQELLDERLQQLRETMDQGIGKVFPITGIEYTRLDGQPYAHRLKLKLVTGDNSNGAIPGSYYHAGGSLGETMTIQWSADKKELHKSGTHIHGEREVLDGNEEYWVSNTQFTYQDREDGDVISLQKYHWFSIAPEIGLDSAMSYSLKQTQDGLNGVYVRGSVSNIKFEGQANDNGGYYLSRTSDSQAPDTYVYRREVFDGEKTLVGAEFCYESRQTAVCDEDSNWSDNPVYNLGYDVTSSPFYLKDGVTEYWSLDPSNATISGLTNNVRNYVVATESGVPPFGVEAGLPFLENGILCRNMRIDLKGNTQSMCWAQASELHNAVVYEEKPGGSFGEVVYELLPNVTVTVNGD